MSTRGSVAWLENGKWVGVYNHYDSYPTNLGAEVFEKAVEMGAENLVNYLKGCGDWRELESGGVCQYCGKVAGQPHSISVMSTVKEGCTLPPDPDAKNHKHGKGKKDQFDPRKNPLFMEWVYLILPEKNVMVIWKCVPNRDRRLDQAWSGQIDDSGYTHIAIKVLPLQKDQTKPRWDLLENSSFHKKLSLKKIGL